MTSHGTQQCVSKICQGSPNNASEDKQWDELAPKTYNALVQSDTSSKTLICKLWNFKTLTIDFRQDVFAKQLEEGGQKADDSALLDLLKDMIGFKIQGTLMGGSPAKELP